MAAVEEMKLCSRKRRRVLAGNEVRCLARGGDERGLDLG